VDFEVWVWVAGYKFIEVLIKISPGKRKLPPSRIIIYLILLALLLFILIKLPDLQQWLEKYFTGNQP